MSELWDVFCGISGMNAVSQSIPPFYADGYTASESVPESTGSISTSHASEWSKSMYAGRGSSGSVFDDPFAMLTWSMSKGALICQCPSHQHQCQCKPSLYPLSVCQPERVSEAKLNDPTSTLITVDPRSSSSFCCSKCLVSAGPTRTRDHGPASFALGNRRC